MFLRKSLFGLAVLALAGASLAQLSCSGLVNSPKVITSDVKVDGGSCTLSNVNITGSVSVVNGGVLTTQGTVFIFGSVSGDGSGNINLGGTLKVNGDLNIINAPNTVVTLGPDADVGKVSITGATKFVGEGTTGSVSGKNSGDITLKGATINGGGLNLGGGNATLTLCGTLLTGGISLGGVTGDVTAVKSPSCAANNITGALLIEKGTGNINIIGNSLDSGDLIVVEQKGDVVVKNGSLSDVSIEKVSGKIELVNLNADSDGSIALSSGSVSITSSKFVGDIGIEATDGDVTITNSEFVGDVALSDATGKIIIKGTNFNFESVTVRGSPGGVIVTNNTDFSISLLENGPITFNNNMARVVSVTKNKGGATINNNKMDTLICADNDPAPTGTGNIIGGIADGQCSGF